MPSQRRPIGVSNPLFKLLLWIVTTVNGTTLVLMALLAFFGNDPATEAQRSLMELCKYGFTTTLGALVGLLCGRSAAPDFIGPLPPQPQGRGNGSH